MNANLYDAVRQGNVEEALRETCQCLIQEHWAALEETWVRLVGFMGESLHGGGGSNATTNEVSRGSNATTTFYRIATELSRLLEQDDLPVKQALLFTTKLLLVFKRPYLKTAAPSTANLQRLRSRIIQYFPPDAQLTRSGKMKFQRFLPTDPEESAFAERIIAGLLHLSESSGNASREASSDANEASGNASELKGALEYLARKKLVLYTAPVLKPVAPAAPQTLQQVSPPEDLVPYLWMILKVIKPLSFDETIEKLYYHGYKPSLKGSRLGFLYAMAFLTENAASSVEPAWNAAEQVLLDRVLENALVLWKEAKAPPAESVHEPEEPLFIPLRPTRAPAADPEPDFYMPPEKTKKVKKTIHITRGRGRNRLGRQLAYDPEPEPNPIKLKDLDAEDFERDDEAEWIRPKIRNADDGDAEDEAIQPKFRNAEDFGRNEKQTKAITADLRGFDLKDNRRKKKEDAPHRDSSGHRGFHFDKAWPRIQDGIRPTCP